jgi:hypothetical protein
VLPLARPVLVDVRPDAIEVPLDQMPQVDVQRAARLRIVAELGRVEDGPAGDPPPALPFGAALDVLLDVPVLGEQPQVPADRARVLTQPR